MMDGPEERVAFLVAMALPAASRSSFTGTKSLYGITSFAARVRVATLQ